MMRAIIPIEKLGRIGYLAFPSFPAAEALCTRRPPEDRGQPAGDWAYEVPLMTTEMSGAWNENDPLVEAAKLNAKPALMRAAYVGTNHAGGNFAPIRVRPSDYLNTDVSAASNKSLSSEPIEIQRQAVLQKARWRGRAIRGSKFGFRNSGSRVGARSDDVRFARDIRPKIALASSPLSANRRHRQIGCRGLTPPGANARGKNEAFPLLRPALADQYRSPRGCLRTMRVRLRGYSSAPTLRVHARRSGSFGYRHALQVLARDAPSSVFASFSRTARESDRRCLDARSCRDRRERQWSEQVARHLK